MYTVKLGQLPNIFDIVVALLISKFEIFSFVNDVQFLNILLKFTTFLVSHVEINKVSSFVQSLTKPSIVVTFEVSQFNNSSFVIFETPLNVLDIFTMLDVFQLLILPTLVSEVQFSNILLILVTFFISHFETSRVVKDEQPLNKYCIFVTLLVFQSDTSRVVKGVQLVNKYCISFT